MDATSQFIQEHLADNVSELALHKKQYPDVDIAFALRQIEGRQRARDKLPEIASIADWHYPATLSVEQSSSETTARHKANVIREFFPADPPDTIADLTGGMGVDTLSLSKTARHTIYIERNPELTALARHNFALTGRQIDVIEADATEYAETMPHVACIYCDPARRSHTGGRVFRLSDCEPDLTTLYPVLAQKADLLMFKLSPMLDISEALRTLTDTVQIDIVAVRGEVKELLAVCLPASGALHSAAAPFACSPANPLIRCLNLETSQPVFSYHWSDVPSAVAPLSHTIAQPSPADISYLYEPNAAIMKAGCFTLLSEHCQIMPLAANSHLFAADTLLENFPGRVFKLHGIADKRAIHGTARSVISRNHPLSADQLHQRFRLRESDTDFLIATRLGNTPILFSATRLS